MHVPRDRTSERRDYRPVHVKGDVSRAAGRQAAPRKWTKQTGDVQGPVHILAHLIFTVVPCRQVRKLRPERLNTLPGATQHHRCPKRSGT